MSAQIGLNGWTFCFRHGFEECSECKLNFREDNESALKTNLQATIDSKCMCALEDFLKVNHLARIVEMHGFLNFTRCP